jgi:hypothetical protein
MRKSEARKITYKGNTVTCEVFDEHKALVTWIEGRAQK